MEIKAISALIYGILITGGGIAGYALKGSVPSLVSGTLFGFLSFLGAYFMYNGYSIGIVLAIASALLVALFFGFQLVKARQNQQPIGRAAGILTLSIVELLVLFLLP